MSTDKNVAIGVELAGRGASVALVDRKSVVYVTVAMPKLFTGVPPLLHWSHIYVP